MDYRRFLEKQGISRIMISLMARPLVRWEPDFDDPNAHEGLVTLLNAPLESLRRGAWERVGLAALGSSLTVVGSLLKAAP